MPSIHDATLPFSLSLHSAVKAVVGHACLLNFWIDNTGDQAITAYRVNLAGGPWAQAPAAAGTPWTHIAAGESVCCPVAFQPEKGGDHPMHVRIDVTSGATPVQAVVPMPILINVPSQQRGGDVILELPRGAMVSDVNTGGGAFESVGEEGSITNIKTIGGSARVVMSRGGFIESIDTSCEAAPASVSVLHQRPPANELLPLRLVRQPAPWTQRGAPDLASFAEGWRQLGRKGLPEFSFIDGQSRACSSARVGSAYILRLRSAAAGYITLLTQSFDAKPYQLLPHRHFGVQHTSGGQYLYLPSRPSPAGGTDKASALLYNMGDAPANSLGDELRFNDLELLEPGEELALVIVSPAPLAEPLAWFDGFGERARSVQPKALEAILTRAWAMPECEVGLAVLNVSSPGAFAGGAG